MRISKQLAVLSLTVLFLAACGSVGDIMNPPSSGSNSYELRGTVESVDSNGRSVYLTNVSGYNASMLSSGGGGSAVRVYYDDQTAVEYQGRSYRPEDLERGDQVTVRVDESGNRLMAERMTVTYDSGGTSNNGGLYGSTLRGTVRNIDTSRGTIEVDTGTGSYRVIDVGSSTPIYYDGKTYRLADLERGDEVEIRLTGSGTSRAQDITVTRSISAGGGINPSPSSSTVRGTVRTIDTSRRTIELEQASWMNNFNSGSNNPRTIIVSYDTNTRVDVQGQLHPVSGLERGDVVDVQVSGSSSSYFANRIILVRDVNSR